MDKCKKIIKKARGEGRSSLLLNEALQICKFHDIPIPEFNVVSEVKEGIEKAKKMGFPIVMKVISPDIIHKSDLGAVVLDIRNENQFETEYKELIDKIKKARPESKIEGILVQKMMPASTEVIVGGSRDKQFGPTVMFGMGGVFTEIYNDVEFRIAPINKNDAMDLIQNLEGSKILKGARGQPPADIDSLVKVLINVSELMVEHEAIDQLDLNPVMVYPNEVSAVDSRIILGEKGEES